MRRVPLVALYVLLLGAVTAGALALAALEALEAPARAVDEAASWQATAAREHRALDDARARHDRALASWRRTLAERQRAECDLERRIRARRLGGPAVAGAAGCPAVTAAYASGGGR